MRIFIVIFIIFSSLISYADEKKALRLMEKGDFEKVIETLDKEISKDSLNPGPYFVYSLLYDHPEFNKRNIDTAYHYAIKALELYPPSDGKDQDKLLKLNISDASITEQKEKLDKKAYERAREEHTLEAYNFYLENFERSILLEDAIADRNALAFQLAEQENTYQAFFQFMLDYPDADEFEKARANYHSLLFQSMTSDGTLEGYKTFLRENPDSPYRNQAIKEIYRISTIGNTEDSYLQFIRTYPESSLIQTAIDHLYHNYRENGGLDFSYRYSFLDLGDSIKRIDQYDDKFMIPVFENQKYGFILHDGEMIIPYSYDYIDESYLCGNIRDDFLRVRIENEQQVVSKTGAVIYDQSYNDVQDLVSGLLTVLDKGKFGVIFKNGEEVLPLMYDEVEALGAQLVKARINDQWYLFAVNGTQLLQYGCEEIEQEGEFLMIRRDGQWAITHRLKLFEDYVRDNIILDFRYDDYELIEPTQVLCFLGDKEGILNHNLEFRIEMDDQRIYTLPEGWLIEHDSTYHLYDDAFVRISGTYGLKDVVFKGKWITGKSGDKWILYYNFAPFPDVFAYDSVNILSEHYVFALDKEDPVLLFPDYKKIKIDKYNELRILHSTLPRREEETVIDYVMVEYDKGKSELYDQNGNLISRGSNRSIQLLGDEYFKTTYRGKVGLLDTSGQELLKPQFQAIANYENGYVSLLNNKKFGIYHKNLGIYLRPAYDRLIKTYNYQYLIAYKSGAYGLIDTQGNEVTDFDFDEIKYWNDTSLLGRMDDSWIIMDILHEEILVEDIKDFDFLSELDTLTMIFRKEDHFGIANSAYGVIIEPTFNDIINIGSEDLPIYFTEKYIPEAEFYIAIYYNAKGEILRKQVFTNEEYDMIYCN